jgi:ribosomal protein S18 acetylase RimI-like enzyme
VARSGGGVREVLAGAEEEAIKAAMGPEGDLVALRLRRGCRCFAAWDADSILGYGWLSTGPEWIGEVGLELTPGPGEAYIWNCVTLPEHRLRGVFRGVVAAICEQAQAEGLRRVWIASLRGTAEAALRPPGFEPALRIQRKGDELQLEVVDSDALTVLNLTDRRSARAGAPRRH